MKTVLHVWSSKPVVIEPATPPKPGKWACVSCPCCGAGVEVDIDSIMSGAPTGKAHQNCYEAALDIEAEALT
jgi:hypothetical protein